MRYTILMEASLENLMASVNELLPLQWQPQGGIVVFTGAPPKAEGDTSQYWGPPCYYFAQAMVKPTVAKEQGQRHNA